MYTDPTFINSLRVAFRLSACGCVAGCFDIVVIMIMIAGHRLFFMIVEFSSPSGIGWGSTSVHTLSSHALYKNWIDINASTDSRLSVCQICFCSFFVFVI